MRRQIRKQILAAATAGTAAVLCLNATAQAQSASQPPRARATAAAALRRPPTTVVGPHMWDPSLNGGKGGPNPSASTVTVTQTTSMVNQQVQVSWTNFTPSSALLYIASNTYYPVMVAECNSTNPASPADCYAAENGGVTSQSGPDGPDNTAYGTTASDGTGVADFHILTGQLNPFLGCSQSHACSLAIVPAQGGNIEKTPADCADHSTDAGFGGTALGNIDFGSTPNDYLCSWAKRIVVPLTFTRTAASCPLRSPAFRVAGSPMLDRAMESWLTALCAGPHGMTISYDAKIPEPTALAELATGQADVALTTRTASAQGISTGKKHHYVYAPVGVSAVSIAYWFDNPLTGLPQTGVKLDQRLLLKLLTQSYAYLNDGCPPPAPGARCDKGVDHNAANLFVDPEFTQLNPNILEPVNGVIEIPTVVSGQSDTTWTATRWIAANRAASQFLAGHPDPYGTHLNTYYAGLQYPTSTFIGQDPFPLTAHEYRPVFPFSQVATDQVLNWPPGTSITKDQQGNYERLPAQPVGQRALIAITGQGDAAAFLFPAAAIRNGAGAYTQPTQAAMAAAVKTMIPAGSGTQQVNLHSLDRAVYPLTMVIYAVAPTSGVSHAKAAAIARFIDYAAGAGQHQGLLPGQLPRGYLPLSPTLRAQARTAAREVLHQTGGTKARA